MFAAEPVFSVRGVRKLETAASEWAGPRFIEWVAAGFECLADRERETEWAVAFAPLVFRSDSSIIGQFAAALAEARRAGFAWPNHLRQAILDHLDTLHPASRKDLTLAIDLWRCLVAMGLDVRDIGLAKLLVKRLTPELADRAPDRVRTLVAALATSVAATPAAPSNIWQFFQKLRNQGYLWDDRLVVPLVDSQLRIGGPAIDENWIGLRCDFHDELTRVADPATPIGRALTRTLAQYRTPDWDRDAETTIETMQAVLDDNEIGLIPADNTAEIRVPVSRDLTVELAAAV